MSLVLAGCSASESVHEISEFRIESKSNWTPETEAFVLRRDGSGFYELYSTDLEDNDFTHKVEKHIDFDKGRGDFATIFAKLKSLEPYSGDDGLRTLLIDAGFQERLKKFFPCGSKVTDAGSLSIWWGKISFEEMEEPKNIERFFAMNAGCRSEEAVTAQKRIQSAINAFDQLVPIDER